MKRISMKRNEERFDSWKEIADYLKRDVSTCIKWAKEYQLPVYRIDPKSLKSPIFAYKREIDLWFQSRGKQDRG